MGTKYYNITVLLIITLVLHIASWLFEERFLLTIPFLKFAVPILYWGAVLSLASDIVISDDKHSIKWVRIRVLRTGGVIFTCILGHATLYRFGGFGKGGLSDGIADWTSSLYFSIVTWTTLGYGDFSPTEQFYLLAASEALMGYVTMSLLIGLIFFRGRD